MPTKKKTEEWTTRLVLVGLGIFILYIGWRNPVDWVVGVPFSVGPLIESAEFRDAFKLIINWKSRKQSVKVDQSPGAQTITAGRDLVYNPPPQSQQAQVPPNLVAVYTAMRKVVRGWQDPRWSNFYEWTQLDENDPHSVIQIKRTAPDLADLCDKAVSVFGEIHILRTEVNALIDDEQEKLVQEFQPKFDAGSRVKFAFFRISANGGNDDQLYLQHAWVKEQNVKEHAEFRARERIPNLKTWKLELMVTGQRLLNPLTQSVDVVTQAVAVDEEAINFGQRVLDYLGTQEPARRLRGRLHIVQGLRGELLPTIERELSKS